MYGRLPPETARGLAQQPAPDGPARRRVSARRAIPTSRPCSIYAADDEFFEPAWERFMARELLGIEPIEIPGGHFPMVEDPDALADLLDRLALEHRRG